MVSIRKCPDCKLCNYHKHKFKNKTLAISHLLFILLLILIRLFNSSPLWEMFAWGYLSFWIISILAILIQHRELKKYKK